MGTLPAYKRRARLPELAAALLLAAGCAGPDAPVPDNSAADARQPAPGNSADYVAPPNIVLILADDLGYGDIGAYGAQRIRTPNIDRLASNGLRFTQGYSSANVCSPSRAGLMTGRYAIRSGLAWKVVDAGSTHGLPQAEETLGELVKRRGYETLYVGKWHLGNFPEYLPRKHGFDEFFGAPASNDMPNFALYDGNVRVEQPVDQSTLTRRYTDRALRFIGENSHRPFMLFLAHTFPHIPLYASEEFRGKSGAGLYGDTVEELDWSTGQVLAALEAHGIAGNTLVIFTSDNGPFFEGGTAGLRGGKGTSWDGGYRVPLIASWPAVIAPGRTTGVMTMNIDVLPTIADILGLAPAAADMDGRSLLPVLRGTDESPHDFLYYFNNERVVGVRSQDWKYVTHAYYLGSLGAFEKFDQLPGFAAPYEMLLDADGIDGEAYSYADRFPGILNEHKEALASARRQFDPLRRRDLEETYPR